jgi:olefin beta-lactone synthetase
MDKTSSLFPINLTSRFFEFARANPNKLALVEPLKWTEAKITEERKWTFADFSNLVQTYQRRLDAEKFAADDHILILLPVSVRMYALVAACLANGLIPIFIDVTLPKEQFLKALKIAAPKAVFSNARLFRYRFLLPALFRARLYDFDHRALKIRDFERVSISAQEAKTFRPETPRLPQDEALITFTSGSTGEPKAADRRFDIVYHQREISKSIWTEGDEDVELTAFPLVVLNNLAFGVTTVLPILSRESGLDGIPMACWADQVERFSVTRLIAPPSILNRMTLANEESRRAFGKIQRLVTGGAPVPTWLMKRVREFQPRSQNFVVYGSTEAEPMAHASFDEIIASRGAGYLVGKSIPEISLKLTSPLPKIPTPEDFNSALSLQPNRRGEIFVSGPHVVERYLFNSRENLTTKFRDADSKSWHRTGDTGYLDDRGWLWLTGRLSDRVLLKDELTDVYPIEHDIENLLKRRAALVTGPSGNAQLCIEGSELSSPEKKQVEEKQEAFGLKTSYRMMAKLPVDQRHFWKIDRQKLRNDL